MRVKDYEGAKEDYTKALAIKDDPIPKDKLDRIEKILEIFKFDNEQKKTAIKLIKSLYRIILEKDASLIEINPLVITKSDSIIYTRFAPIVLDLPGYSNFIRTKESKVAGVMRLVPMSIQIEYLRILETNPLERVV